MTARSATHEWFRERGVIWLFVGLGVACVLGAVWPEIMRRRTTPIEESSHDLEVLANCVKVFRLREARLPDEREWPGFLFEGSAHHPEPYLEVDRFPHAEVLDPWGNPYVYRRFDAGFEILSFGGDGQAGGVGRDADQSYRSGS